MGKPREAAQPVDDETEDEGNSTEIPSSSKKFIPSVADNLTEEELYSKGVVKYLIKDNNKLEDENRRLKKIEQEFNSVNVKYQVLQNKNNKSVLIDIATSILFTLGGFIISMPSFDANTFSKQNWFYIICGFVFIGLSILIRIFGNKSEKEDK